MKKILASLMAVLLAFGACMFVVFAEEPTEPTEPTEPAYVPVEYQITDLVAAVEKGKDVYLQPTDIILLPQTEEPTTEPAEDDGETPAAAQPVLIVEYLPDAATLSDKKISRCIEYVTSGYAILALGDRPQFVYTDTGREEGPAIDFANENGYAFKQWKVKSIYSGNEFSRIVLVVDWEPPVLTGWAGFKTMMRGYIKTIIDYIIKFVNDWFLQLGDFLVGSPT